MCLVDGVAMQATLEPGRLPAGRQVQFLDSALQWADRYETGTVRWRRGDGSRATRNPAGSGSRSRRQLVAVLPASSRKRGPGGLVDVAASAATSASAGRFGARSWSHASSKRIKAAAAFGSGRLGVELAAQVPAAQPT